MRRRRHWPCQPVPRLVADDVTPEAAASLLAEQGGRLAVLSAEGGIFATLAGRYSGAPNLEVFLKGHAGDLLIVDRKGRDPPNTSNTPHSPSAWPCNPKCSPTSPPCPASAAAACSPASSTHSPPPPSAAAGSAATTVPEPSTEAYATTLRALVLTLADWTDPAVLTLTPDANDAVLHLEELIEPRLLADRGDLAPIVDWASKYVGAIVRIAGLLHLASQPARGWTQPITAATIDRRRPPRPLLPRPRPRRLRPHGRRPHSRQRPSHVLDWITPHQHARSSPAASCSPRIRRGRFRKVTELDPVLDLLIAHGFIRPGPAPTRPAGGRLTALRSPSPCTELHKLQNPPGGTR